MAKVQRRKVVIDATYYNFDQRYEQAMERFDDVKVISINVISSKHGDDSIREEYLVFYEELPEEDENIGKASYLEQYDRNLMGEDE